MNGTEESQPFLSTREHKQEIESSDEHHQHVCCSCGKKNNSRIHWFYLSLCLILSVVLFISLGYKELARSNGLNTLALTGEPLKLQRQYFDLASESLYAGPPSLQLDHAWRSLLDHVNIRGYEPELSSKNQSSVLLPDGKSSLVWLEKFLRQWIYKDHYHAGVTPEEEAHWLLHADHCIELMRQATMCRADTSLMTFEWKEGEEKPMLKLESPEHTCVDWDSLMLKIQPRRVSDAEMAELQNPDQRRPHQK